MLPVLDPSLGPLFTLVVCRIGGIMAVAPWWDSSVVPHRWRIALAILIGLLVTPTVAADRMPAADGTTWSVGLLLVALQEVGLGAVTGVALRLIWTAVSWTVQLVGPLSGLSMSDVFEPGSGDATPALGQLLRLTMAAGWFSMGGHRQAIAALLDTFRAAPPGSAQFDEQVLPAITDLLGQSCLAGVRAGAPLVAVLLASWLVIGGVARLAPRSAAWMWGASLASVVGLAGVSLTLGYMSWTFQDHFETTLVTVERIWTQWADVTRNP